MKLSHIVCVLVAAVSVLAADPYNTSLASHLTYLSSIAYEPQNVIEAWSC
jgi:hypothetical protein